MKQDTIFEDFEADNWFLRNKDKILEYDENNDIICNFLKKFNDKSIETVLELGSSNGFRLDILKRIFPNIKRAVGVDASKLSIEDGKERYNLEMYVDNIVDFKDDSQFDLVIVNFVYHWIDRSNIANAIANTDNLVKDGGYLIIGDFLPDFPQKRNYHHLEENEVYTFKLDYSKIFEDLNIYKKIFQITYNTGNKWNGDIEFIPSSSRASCSILKKSLENYYRKE